MRQGTSIGLLFALCTVCLGLDAQPLVTTDKGPVTGKIRRTEFNSVEYTAFKGIPYAKPPLGELRFKPPVEPEPWQEPVKAVDEANLCMQPGWLSTLGNEDCLYLNVYTPEVQFKNVTKLRPVMVWIYGGAFYTGYSISAIYGPDFFLEDDVVFVSLNYRLGVLGFLALNHADALGNAGLKDQNLALKWVQKNIAAFGGDPNRVTLFGESAGGASVGFHLLSERSKGLFHKAIAQSGSPLCPWAIRSPEDIKNSAYALCKKLKCTAKTDEDLLQFLRQASAEDIIKESSSLESGQVPLRFPFVPTVENPELAPEDQLFLKECPMKKFSSGNFNKMPVMLGFNKDEGITFTLYLDVAQQLAFGVLDELGKLGSAKFKRFIDRIHRAVEGDVRKVMKYESMVDFIGPVDLTQKYVSKFNNQPVYYYRLSYESQYQIHKLLNPNTNGTAHADDIGYLFNVALMPAPSDTNHPFNQFRNSMVSLWTNFAKYGDPTPVGKTDPLVNTTWSASGSNGRQFDINTPSSMQKRMTDMETEVYEELMQATLTRTAVCQTNNNSSSHRPNL